MIKTSFDDYNQFYSLKINYVILNFLSQEEMWCYFQNTSLTIMTPISDGTPNSALEAMASKSPLIISDLPHKVSKYIYLVKLQ